MENINYEAFEMLNIKAGFDCEGTKIFLNKTDINIKYSVKDITKYCSYIDIINNIDNIDLSLYEYEDIKNELFHDISLFADKYMYKYLETILTNKIQIMYVSNRGYEPNHFTFDEKGFPIYIDNFENRDYYVSHNGNIIYN